MDVQHLINFYLRMTGAYEIRIDNLHNRLNFDLGKKNKSFHQSLKGISKLVKLQSLVASYDKNDRRYSSMKFASFDLYIFGLRAKKVAAKMITFPRVIQIYTKSGNFPRLYFPHFKTFRHQTLQSY